MNTFLQFEGKFALNWLLAVKKTYASDCKRKHYIILTAIPPVKTNPQSNILVCGWKHWHKMKKKMTSRETKLLMNFFSHNKTVKGQSGKYYKVIPEAYHLWRSQKSHKIYFCSQYRGFLCVKTNNCWDFFLFLPNGCAASAKFLV